MKEYYTTFTESVDYLVKQGYHTVASPADSEQGRSYWARDDGNDYFKSQDIDIPNYSAILTHVPGSYVGDGDKFYVSIFE